MRTMNKQSVQYIFAGILVVVGIWGISSYLVGERLEEFERIVAVQHEKQRGVLSVLAETTSRNGADEITESIVRDCPLEERVRFDELLGSLDAGLSRPELIELERLFAGCGTFFAERKAVMVARLEREFAVYRDYTEQLASITGSKQDASAQLEAWESLVQYENDQSRHFGRLVELQDKIITSLLAGNTLNSPELMEILTAVREARENLALANTQAARVRGELLSI